LADVVGERGTEIKEEDWRGDGRTRGRAKRNRKTKRSRPVATAIHGRFCVVLSFRKSRERKGGRRDGGREGWRDSSPSSDDASLHHHQWSFAIAMSLKYGPSTNKAKKKKKNSITYF
jgi:hypothetical protein